MSRLRCAYLVSRYPTVTHTFVQSEIRALRALGAEIRPVTVRRPDAAEVLSPEDAREHSATHALLPSSPVRLVRAHARAFARAPGAYLRTLLGALLMGPGGARRRVWQAFYFAEAMLLWDWLESQGLRHVHVHFANVAGDVAMLCTRYANAAGGGGRRWTWSLTVHGPTELLDMSAHKLAEKVSDADTTVCTSDFVRSQLMALVPQECWPRLHTIRCGIDRERYHPPAAGRDDSEPPQILTVAGMSRRKGYDVLLEALADLAGRGAEFGALLVGDGDERARLEAQSVALGLAGRVRFAGALGQDVVPGLYRDADVFCLPSYAEGVPTVLMEAMASELPAVATHIMGVPELIDDGHSGLLVPPGRADLLADALERLIADPDLRKRLGRAAAERVAERYDLPMAGRQLEAVLDRIAQR
jgi:glycosyltransferase involved in cell wall biosynthesis